MSWTAAVANSWQTMIRLPSPARQTTVSSGFATWAPIAAGRPKPIVPRPPELIHRRGGAEGEDWAPPTPGWPAAGGRSAAPPPPPASAPPPKCGLVSRPGQAPSPPREHFFPGREAAQAHDGARDGEAIGRAELGQLLGRVGVDHPAAGVDDRAAGVGQRLGRQPDLLLVALQRGLVAGQADVAGGGLVLDVRPRQVLRDVDEHRTRPSRARQVEGLVDRL